MNKIIYLFIFFLFANGIVNAQSISDGLWQGNIKYSNATIPFQFKLAGPSAGGLVEISLMNGEEEILIKNATIERDSIIIPMHAFDATIRAKFSNNSMTGVWVKNYKNNWRMPFTAEFGLARFDQKKSKKGTKIEPTWSMTFNPEYGAPYPSIGYFNQDQNKITGTVMSGTGDLRFFEGIVVGDSIKMSSFDGAHGFLLLGKKYKNKWLGGLVFDDGYTELWEAYADENATLNDPFVEIDNEKEAKTKPYFDILTAGSGFNTLEIADFEGKVTVIQLLGSWCPNSLDETNYLVKWFDDNKAKDIEVLAVFFEMNYSQEYGMERIEEYTKATKIPYATALGGKANKGQAALAFPFINKIEAFPTLIILDKKGNARYMHTYFQGPATGQGYVDFDIRFKAIIKELLNE